MSEVPGVLCVATLSGTTKKPPWSADNWGSSISVGLWCHLL